MHRKSKKKGALILPEHDDAELAGPISTEARVAARIIFRPAPLALGKRLHARIQSRISGILVCGRRIVARIFHAASFFSFEVSLMDIVHACLLVRPAADDENTALLRVHALQEEERQEHVG